MPLSRPRRNRHAKRKLHPAWEKLLKERIEAVVASGGVFGRPPKGSSSKTYEEPITEAVRARDVSVEDLMQSSEISAKGKTWRRWFKAAEQVAS